METSISSTQFLQHVSGIEKACRIVVDCLKEVGKYVKSGVSTFELDRIADDFIRSANAEPAFKGYKPRSSESPYPFSLCVSIDEEVVHGMPSERKLKEGQIVSADVGVKLNGFFGDSAYTFSVGEVSDEKKRLIQITQESLELGVSQAVTGKKVYDISRAVQSHVEKARFSVVRELVGHGIGRNLHEEPSIPNFVPLLIYRNQFPNVKLRRGQGLAIEPMVNFGSCEVKTAQDGWTVYATDAKPSAHFEHTVIVDDIKPIVLTTW